MIEEKQRENELFIVTITKAFPVVEFILGGID